MNKFLLYGLQMYCVFVYIVFFCNAEGLTQSNRFTNQQRLFPFPRVGRGRETRFDLGLGRPNEDRISLFAFPRIGRSDESFPKRDAKNLNTGLWFGPRLGRVHKRDVYVYDLPHNYPREIIFAGGKYDMDNLPETRQVHYTPRLGRESEEDIQQSIEEP